MKIKFCIEEKLICLFGYASNYSFQNKKGNWQKFVSVCHTYNKLVIGISQENCNQCISTFMQKPDCRVVCPPNYAEFLTPSVLLMKEQSKLFVMSDPYFTWITQYVTLTLFRHYPKTSFTIVADTPENLRLRQQSELQSQVCGTLFITYNFIIINQSYTFPSIMLFIYQSNVCRSNLAQTFDTIGLESELVKFWMSVVPASSTYYEVTLQCDFWPMWKGYLYLPKDDSWAIYLVKLFGELHLLI